MIHQGATAAGGCLRSGIHIRWGVRVLDSTDVTLERKFNAHLGGRWPRLRISLRSLTVVWRSAFI